MICRSFVVVWLFKSPKYFQFRIITHATFFELIFALSCINQEVPSRSFHFHDDKKLREKVMINNKNSHNSMLICIDVISENVLHLYLVNIKYVYCNRISLMSWWCLEMAVSFLNWTLTGPSSFNISTRKANDVCFTQNFIIYVSKFTDPK